MLRSSLSSWFGLSVGRKKTKTSGTPARANRQAGRRILRVEQLEDRQMLSVSVGVAVPAGVALMPRQPSLRPTQPDDQQRGGDGEQAYVERRGFQRRGKFRPDDRRHSRDRRCRPVDGQQRFELLLDL